MMTQDEIKTARIIAEEIGPDVFAEKFLVDWRKPRIDGRARVDGRSGNVHAWDQRGEYLGRFRTQRQAVEENAAYVTRIDNTWFVWQVR